jgi:hypothetical protein
MTAPGSDRYVLLKGGLAVPIEPLRLLWDLEERGYRVCQDGEDLLVHPGRTLTDEDRASIRRWKSHLLALVAYVCRDE